MVSVLVCIVVQKPLVIDALNVYVKYMTSTIRPVFSKHALERLRERGADKAFIESIVLRHVDAIYLKSKTEDGVTVGTGKAAGKHWTVIFSEESNVIITVRRASATEAKWYETKINKAAKGRSGQV